MDSVNSQTRLPVMKLLLLGLVFHLVYIGTVFDCYFTSPVVKGMQSYGAAKGEAKRLVLIVGALPLTRFTTKPKQYEYLPLRLLLGDGLRADLLLSLNPFPNIPDAPEVVAPHLRSVIERRGAFGISHTRVPTESRPGHVALIGGLSCSKVLALVSL